MAETLLFAIRVGLIAICSMILSALLAIWFGCLKALRDQAYYSYITSYVENKRDSQKNQSL